MSTLDHGGLQALSEEVYLELHRLQTTWAIHNGLFGARQSVEVLRESAIITFGALQELLIEAMYLRTHRLLESGTRGRRAASIQTLVSSLPPNAAPLRRRLQKTLATVRTDCLQLSEWRDRVVAHNDLETALMTHPEPLERVKMRTVRNAIQEMAAALSAISDELGLNLRYDPDRESADLDVDELIRRLEVARTL